MKYKNNSWYANCKGRIRLIVLYALFLFIDIPEVRDINYQIALGLLENGHELDYLTINELAERCFVSTSSLNRFFRIYGYNKYMIFKAVFSSILKSEDYERLIDMSC